MTPFTLGELRAIRASLHDRVPMITICALMRGHARDQVVEAIDALRRHESLHDAQRHLHNVLAMQSAGIPLINGHPVGDFNTVPARYRPMF